MNSQLPDISIFFERYERIAAEADAAFQYIRSHFPLEVICKEGCSSCCHALFDLSLIEALYLNSVFNTVVQTGMERSALLDRANEIDRKLATIKRRAFKASKEGKENNHILEDMAAVQVACPLLGPDDRCLLYSYRPITCRLYGIPISIGGKGHTCGKTGFTQGGQYPTVFLDKIQDKLAALSEELAQYIGSAYPALATMYIPVSGALLTEYNAQYLGIGGIVKDETL